MKPGVLIAVLLCACGADDSDDVGPDGGEAVDVAPYLGEWGFEFDASACERAGTYRTGFVVAMVGGEPDVTTWSLHESYEAVLEPFDDSLGVTLDVTSGPPETFDLVLIAEPPQVAFHYLTQVGTEPCVVDGVGANVTLR